MAVIAVMVVNDCHRSQRLSIALDLLLYPKDVH